MHIARPIIAQDSEPKGDPTTGVFAFLGIDRALVRLAPAGEGTDCSTIVVTRSSYRVVGVPVRQFLLLLISSSSVAPRLI